MNEDVDVDYEWEEFYENNKTIPPHASRLFKWEYQELPILFETKVFWTSI